MICTAISFCARIASIGSGLFKAVNPARPVSPMNSRLLSLFCKTRFKRQVIGR
jgi:hypothetical protein